MNASATGMPADDPAQRFLLEEAADWHSIMSSGDVSAEDREACRLWRARSPQHEAAWQELDRIWSALSQQAQVLPGKARGVVTRPARRRRNLRRSLLALAILVPLGSLALHSATPAWLLADYRSHVGERRSLALEDGSTLILNTDSAVDVVFSNQERRIVLRQGEILVQVAADSTHRPFVVHTAQGDATAKGTRYLVRQLPGATEVSVTESRVTVCATQAEACAELDAGQSVRMSEHGLDSQRAIDVDSVEAWTRGQISVRDMPLPDVLDQLARHRRSLFWFDRQALQGLRVSGVMPLQGDEALQALQELLPIEIKQVVPGVLRISRR